MKERFLKKLLKKSEKYSPIVGVFGHRQVGKTTLVSSLSKNYLTLDQRSQLKLAEDDPEAFLSENQKGLLAFNECQLAPPIKQPPSKQNLLR